MNDEQLLRYSRQIALPVIGIEGQERLLQSHVLIIGVGGLGSPTAMYLAAAGVGRLTLVDFDKVDLTNLQRQIIHDTAGIGRNKTDSARERLHALNPDCHVTTLCRQLQGQELADHVAAADVVIDCSDNFATRFAVNDACVSRGTPLVSGAAIRMEGQVAVFSGLRGTPCYRCLYPEETQLDDTCSANGVLAPLVGIIGSIQATEAIKLLTGAGTTLSGQLLLCDALHMEWRSLAVRADPECPVCGDRRER